MAAAVKNISREQEVSKNFEEESNERLARLFYACDDAYFWGKMSKTVKVRWSKRMTACAGTTLSAYKKQPITVSLSRKILEMRPLTDLLETLLHEMIHAYIWVEKIKEKEEHGPIFHEHMKRVGKIAGVELQVCHDFQDECDLLLKHIWRCNGPCRKTARNRGYIRRAINREPSKNEKWFQEHDQDCGGQFVKIQAPNQIKTGKDHEFDYRLDEEIESFLEAKFPKYSKPCFEAQHILNTREETWVHTREENTKVKKKTPKTKDPKVEIVKITNKKDGRRRSVAKTVPFDDLPKTKNSKVKTAKTTKSKIPQSKPSTEESLDEALSEKQNVSQADLFDALPKTKNSNNLKTPKRKLSAGLQVKYKLTNRKGTPYPTSPTDFFASDSSSSSSDSPVMNTISKNKQRSKVVQEKY